MEFSSTTITRSVSTGGGGGGEVRRLHIIYFLSRMGCVEHPHLIRVHHLTRNGVFLRDVKRWLAELRGKDMPESFAWSYKRRYKNGYVWQDLIDDDLITPISDNEYILKGSEIVPVSPCADQDSGTHVEKKTLVLKIKSEVHDDDEVQTEDKKQEQLESHKQENEAQKLNQDSKVDTPSIESSQSYQESLVFYSESSTTDDSIQQESNHNSHNDHNLHCKVGIDTNKEKKTNKKKKYVNKIDKEGISTSGSSFSSSSATPPHNPQFAKTKSSSISGTPKMLRNLMTCGGVNTNDSVFVKLHKLKPEAAKKDKYKTEISNEDRMKVSGSPRKLQEQLQLEARKSFTEVPNLNNQKWRGTIGRQKKPLGDPTCSQCGKHFKPEKLHAHMKNCRGMKGLQATDNAANSKEHTSSSCKPVILSTCTDSNVGCFSNRFSAVTRVV